MILRILASLGLTLVLVSPAGATDATASLAAAATATVAAPTITSFAASATSVSAGSSTTLSWVTTNGTTVTLNGSTVTGSSSKVVTPSATTTYTLVVTNSAGSVSKALTVTVVALPTISSFSSSPYVITAGGSTVFTGVFSGGTGYNPVAGTVTSGKGFSLTYANEGYYSQALVVTNSLGAKVTANATVIVYAVPTASLSGPVSISLGDGATLTGTFTGGTGVIGGVGSVTSGTGVVVHPTQTTTYTLTVTNGAGTQATAAWTVVVYPLPTASVSPAATTITLGYSAILTPTFAGGTGVISGVGSVVSGTPVTVTPNITTTYTLTVTNPANGSVTASSVVTVAGSPTISSFAADKVLVTTGQGTVLRFAFTNGTAVVYKGTSASGTLLTATPVSGGSGSQAITVDATGSYTLVVTNAAGLSVNQSVTVTAVAPAVISSFVAAKKTVTVGTSTTLTGFFSGGTGAVSPTVGAVSTNAASTVTPTATTVYTLTVTNAAKDAVTAQVTVTVVDMPAIQSFTADSLTVRPGKPAVLTGTFTGGTGVVAPTVGPVTSGTGVSVTPDPGRTTYTLTVTNAAGSVVSANLTVNSNLTLKWVRDIVYLGGKEVAEVDATGRHIPLTDHLGSPRLLVSGAGVLESEQKFTPFGEVLCSSSKFAKGFTNHEQTDASGLVYMQARFYMPVWGRFMSPDPGRDQHLEETQSWNLYSYVQNSPVMNIDPTGMILDSNNKDLMLTYGRRIAPNADLTWSETDGYRIALKDGESTSKGFELFSRIISSSNTMTLNFNIGQGSSGVLPGSGAGDATINIDISQQSKAWMVNMDAVGSDGRRPMSTPAARLGDVDQTTTVLHELIHGLHRLEGTQDFSIVSNILTMSPMKRELTNKEELNTIGIHGYGMEPVFHGITENGIRKELGYALFRISHAGSKE